MKEKSPTEDTETDTLFLYPGFPEKHLTGSHNIYNDI